MNELQLYQKECKDKIKSMITNYVPGYGEFLRRRYQNCKHVCVWGCGNMGRHLPLILQKFGITVDCYCDNDKTKWGMDVKGYGVTCISPEELRKIKDETAVIIPTRYYNEIYQQLAEMQFPLVDRIFHAKFAFDEFFEQSDKAKIVSSLCETIDILSDIESCRVLTRLIEEWTKNEYQYGQLDDIYSYPQYFPEDILPNADMCKNYVDGGAYNGDNIADFVQYTNGDFEKYYAFELNHKNSIELEENIDKNFSKYKEHFVIENKGISNETKTIKYMDACEGSKINTEGTVEGQVVSLDDYFCSGQKVDFIKMDIEGAEMDALKGSSKTIAENYPVLAICIYHKPSDLWELPLYIKENWGKYSIFIRHHTDLLAETVCYAVLQN